MTVSARMRKAGLTLHVVSSVGWLGAVLVHLALGIAALTSDDTDTGVYESTDDGVTWPPWYDGSREARPTTTTRPRPGGPRLRRTHHAHPGWIDWPRRGLELVATPSTP